LTEGEPLASNAEPRKADAYDIATSRAAELPDDGNGSPAEAEQAGRPDEEIAVAVAAADGDALHWRAVPESESLHRENSAADALSRKSHEQLLCVAALSIFQPAWGDEVIAGYALDAEA
jgi:hypothetical protein